MEPDTVKVTKSLMLIGHGLMGKPTTVIVLKVHGKKKQLLLMIHDSVHRSVPFNAHKRSFLTQKIEIDTHPQLDICSESESSEHLALSVMSLSNLSPQTPGIYIKEEAEG